jgi:hypothetical protein
MIEIALLLGRHVDARYYADAERFGRNHLLESQLLSLERLEQALERLPAETEPAQDERQYSTCENVAASQVGGFASRSTLNDAFHLDAAQMMQCCNGAGTRALYDLWRYALQESKSEDGKLALHSVHLRFSVAIPTFRVVSYEPAEGRLDLVAHQTSEVAVRLPEGTTQALVVNDGNSSRQVIAPAIHDGYIHFHMGEGERAEVYYPLVERRAEYEVGAGDRSMRCTGYWRGETLMRVEPPGQFYPLYKRSTELEPVEPSSPNATPIESL